MSKLTPFQSAKLTEWAEYLMVNGDDGSMPRGIEEVACWVANTLAGRTKLFPQFDTTHPYTFGE